MSYPATQAAISCNFASAVMRIVWAKPVSLIYSAATASPTFSAAILAQPSATSFHSIARWVATHRSVREFRWRARSYDATAEHFLGQVASELARWMAAFWS